jgi:hypothetical protein
MIAVWAAWLPVATVFIGLAYGICYVWPLPWCAERVWKSIYLFLQARWQFDYVWNQQIAAPILNMGAQTWLALDKGVLELLGPRGLTTAVTDWAVPSVRQWQTGTVHDYALVLKVCVVFGLVALALPSLWVYVGDLGGTSVDARALVVAALLVVLVP